MRNVADEDFETMLLADVARYFGLSTDFSESLALVPRDELLERMLEQGRKRACYPRGLKHLKCIA